MQGKPTTLWRHADFLKLWIGQTISEVGSRISRDGLPLTAVLTLGASPAQMGVLLAVGTSATLLFGLGVGVLVDRLRRRPVLIWADLGRALVLSWVPLAAVMKILTIPQLYAVAALTGVLTVFFDVAYQSYLPSLVERAYVLEGNRKLGLSSSTAEIVGPGLTGLLVQLITAPVAILFDAISYLFSAGSVALIRKAGTAAETARRCSCLGGSERGRTIPGPASAAAGIGRARRNALFFRRIRGEPV